MLISDATQMGMHLIHDNQTYPFLFYEISFTYIHNNTVFYYCQNYLGSIKLRDTFCLSSFTLSI